MKLTLTELLHGNRKSTEVEPGKDVTFGGGIDTPPLTGLGGGIDGDLLILCHRQGSEGGKCEKAGRSVLKRTRARTALFIQREGWEGRPLTRALHVTNSSPLKLLLIFHYSAKKFTYLHFRHQSFKLVGLFLWNDL